MTTATPEAFGTDRLRMREAVRMARVSRQTIYVWIKAGSFRSWVVKARGRERGIRFIDRETFEAFLKSQREEAA